MDLGDLNYAMLLAHIDACGDRIQRVFIEGPGGSGKTMLGARLSTELGWAYVTGREVLSGMLNLTEITRAEGRSRQVVFDHMTLLSAAVTTVWPNPPATPDIARAVAAVASGSLVVICEAPLRTRWARIWRRTRRDRQTFSGDVREMVLAPFFAHRYAVIRRRLKQRRDVYSAGFPSG